MENIGNATNTIENSRSNTPNNKQVKLLLIGVGGCGNNAIDNMIASGLKDVSFAAVNTDRQALASCRACDRLARLQIGESITEGMGSGSDPHIGEQAALSNKVAIERQLLNGVNMCIIIAGMGGGTGTGAAPVIAGIARELNILTLAIVTRPFDFEGSARIANADVGIDKLRKNVDSLIVVNNQGLFANCATMDVREAFRYADGVLLNATTALTDIIMKTYRINVDFADIRMVLSNNPQNMDCEPDIYIGIGQGEGKDACAKAVRVAVSNELVSRNIEGATKAILTVIGDVTLNDLSTMVNMVTPSLSSQALIKTGYDERIHSPETVMVTVITAGYRRERRVNPFADDDTAYEQSEPNQTYNGTVTYPDLHVPNQNQNHAFTPNQPNAAIPETNVKISSGNFENFLKKIEKRDKR